MKYIPWLMLHALFPVWVFAQGGGYIVKGELSKLKTPAKVFFGYSVGGGYKEDSVIVKNGRFEFKGTITEPSPAWIRIRHAGAIDDPYVGYDNQDLYIEKGAINVTGKDSIATAVITGGAVNRVYQKLCEVIKPVNKLEQEVSAIYYAATPEERNTAAFKEKLKAKYIMFQTEQKRVLTKFVQENNNSVVCFRAIDIFVRDRAGVNDVELLYKLLTKEVQQTEKGKQWAANIKKLKAIEIGAMAPPFVQNDPNGKPVKLEDFRGKYVLIDFWSSGCKPCRAENPLLVKTYHKYKDKNFTIVGISTDINKEAWLNAIKEDDLPWTQLDDLKDINEAVETYYIRGIPSNFLIDPKGIIIAKELHGEELEKKLEEILSKG